jgi:hypothetical protein
MQQDDIFALRLLLFSNDKIEDKTSQSRNPSVCLTVSLRLLLLLYVLVLQVSTITEIKA